MKKAAQKKAVPARKKAALAKKRVAPAKKRVVAAKKRVVHAKKTVRAKSAAQTKKGVATKKAVHPQKSGSGRAKPLVDAQPQSQSQAATEAGMFLHTDDAWSNAYFDVKDLHCKERVLFG